VGDLTANNLNAALAARAPFKKAALLKAQSSPAKATVKRIAIDDAISVYLSNTAATKKHRTLLAYTLATGEFRKSCTKQFLDELTKQDLTDFVVAMKKQGLADRTIDNRLTDLGTFLHANNVALSLHQSYTEKKVRACSIEELRGLNGASADEELRVWQFFLSTGFREDEVAHACYTDEFAHAQERRPKQTPSAQALFQHPQAFTLRTRMVSVMTIFQQQPFRHSANSTAVIDLNVGNLVRKADIYGEPLCSLAGGSTYMSAAIGGKAVASQMHFSVSTLWTPI
jgi:hypothetical protein